jgi:hypothetical protein
LEEIIADIKAGDEISEDDIDKAVSSTRDNENKRVMEAVEEGLLQVHGTAPNTKQQGIFRILGENCNGNRRLVPERDLK